MDIVKLMIGFVALAAVVTGIAFAATYWYYFVGAGIVGFIIYAATQKQKDKENQV